METIYRFKKRMVYPEKLTLDQVAGKSSSSSSWCSQPLEKHATSSTSFINNGKLRVKSADRVITYKSEQNRSPSLDNVSNPSPANRQFIEDRIRHLVDAFSTRAQAAKERIETPATPSSISSRETIENNSVEVNGYKQKLSLDSEHSEDELDPAKRQRRRQKFSLYKNIKYVLDNKVIDPHGKFYMIWMSIAAISVMYNVWVIPLRSTFPYQTPENRLAWMSFDYLADFVYFIDMILIQPRVKYLSEGFWVTDMHQLRHNYIRKKAFKMDVLSLLPLDILYLITGPEFVLLRFPRFFKLHTFWEFFSFVDRLLVNPYIIRMTRTLIYMMYLIHLNACAYYAFSSWEGIGSNNFVYNGKGNAYFKCFYFGTKTATSIGKNPKPTQEVEYLFMTVLWLMGVFVFAVLIGQTRDLFSTANRNKTEYQKLLTETLEYMGRLNLPQDMKKRVQLWLNFKWKTQHTLDENTIMDCLPHKMKTDIAINVHIQTLSKVKLFADCDESLLRELVLQLRSVIYLPGDIICKKGYVGNEMYIIQSGKVQVIGRTENEVLATLSEGSVFGEISLLGIAGMNRRTADVRSQGYSNLFVLSKADLNAALKHYPEAQELLNKKAKMLMKKNAALERRHNAMIIIDNPTPPPKQAKLLETVLQVLPPDSKSNRLLRYGSRGKPSENRANDRFKYRNSLPSIKTYGSIDKTFQTKATIHRTLS